MRKKIISQPSSPAIIPADAWLDLEPIATIELSSEDPLHPIEDALSEAGQGFLAATTGPQTIRVLFDAPRTLHRILLLFVEATQERTQEFVLRWSTDGNIFTEIVRQQWNFNLNATHQREDYRVELQGLRVLELVIKPDLQGDTSSTSLARAPQPAIASLAALRLS